MQVRLARPQGETQKRTPGAERSLEEAGGHSRVPSPRNHRDIIPPRSRQAFDVGQIYPKHSSSLWEGLQCRPIAANSVTNGCCKSPGE